MNYNALIAGAALALSPMATQAEDLSLAYWMGPGHPMNAAVFTPFAENLAEVSGGEMTVELFAGGALNGSPPSQYGIMLDGVADIAFVIPGYTGDVFPVTGVITYPGICESAADCTASLWRARDQIAAEYDAVLLGLWGNNPPVLITRDQPVRTLEDIAGMIVRVTSTQDVAFAEALGASGVTQPVNVINQNLTNGVVDAIAIGPSAIGSFNLHEPGNYITTYFPGSGSAFALLMNQDVFDDLTEEQQGWVMAAADESLSQAGGDFYDRAAARGLEIAREAGVEIIDLTPEERARWDEAMAPLIEELRAQDMGGTTAGAIMDIMIGE
ncbi:TRAP transporter substrate-binding protein [Jannaschia sp. CCS1]|uniref:TRAP transporter substrate-binding protein n=1 Tax=Jannaschia sp. (strain CCS1) TaxID=290400 RepID=UPI000053CF8D|nr:TRAP transporter substrate-binding protein [Jannaschia sp. CCS1]ABD56707.1 TRAP dicarboxylate transporter- DctP subunit [Jannaschia sp. CCS1]